MSAPPPMRRSSRQATVQATQISEGTLRPPGPPHLEAALDIALDHLHSETWGYLAHYIEQHKGQPLPSVMEIKAASASVRRAALAVDRAESVLEAAIDQMVEERRRVGVVVGSKYVEPDDVDIDSTPRESASNSNRESQTSSFSANHVLASNGTPQESRPGVGGG